MEGRERKKKIGNPEPDSFETDSPTLWLVAVPCPPSFFVVPKQKGHKVFSTFSYSDSLISYIPLSLNPFISRAAASFSCSS